MEVEETSETDGFLPIPGNRKRKKSLEVTGAVVVEEKVEQNLLSNNKFSPVPENNNNNNANPAGGRDAPADPAPGQSASKQKQPPLVVKNTTAFYKLFTIVDGCEFDFGPIYKLTRFGTKVICFSVRDFDKLQELLMQNKVEFYTHERRSERSQRFVIRGLPDVGPEQVKKLLKRNIKLYVLEVHAIKRKEQTTMEEIPYIIVFSKGYTTLKKLSTTE